MQGFTQFIGIDWTGAKGSRHSGLAVASCIPGDGAPVRVKPPSGKRRWSRHELASWLAGGIGRRAGERVLVGIDSSFGMPFVDEGAYLPANDSSTACGDDVADLWRAVANHAPEVADFYAGAFVEQYADHYLRGAVRGPLYRRRMRVAEILAVATGAGPCESAFHLVGPSQVGLSGLSTMAMLHHIKDHSHIAIWPFDNCATAPVVVVEIYAALFAALGGHRGKIRDAAALKSILLNLQTSRMPRLGLDFDDHIADACVTAAALRLIGLERKYWNPLSLSAKVRRTEGWIFGVEQ
ncbi:hypothetical protein [Kordiimonas sp.]|uniref:hypothetical protein n=1 Tax=Kordiimonas sp. TaxID=1970157 RepID=UPI003A9228DF